MNGKYLMPILGSTIGLLLGLLIIFHNSKVKDNYEKVIYNDSTYTCQSRTQSLINYTCLTPNGEEFDLIGDKIIIRK